MKMLQMTGFMERINRTLKTFILQGSLLGEVSTNFVSNGKYNKTNYIEIFWIIKFVYIWMEQLKLLLQWVQQNI